MNLRQLRVELLKMASGMPGALIVRDKPPADLAIELARKFEGYVREDELEDTEDSAHDVIPEPPVEEQAPRRGRPPKRKVEKPGARRRGRPRKKGDPIFE